ncbi:MAG: ATP synthase subunit I [Oscillospiraceae bacterium]|nr:ATP synthase subunit I [Oscillospiraceae bacterium]
MSKFIQRMINDYDEERESIITAKNVRFAAVGLCVLVALGSLLFGGFFPTLKGLLLGGAVAQLLFRQHELTIGKSLKSSNPSGITVSNYMVRLIIRGVTLFVAIQNPDVGIIGCILGLLSIPYGIYVLAFADWIIQRKTGKEV